MKNVNDTKGTSGNNRNLLGDFDFWAGVFPFLSIAAFIAGWFTVTVEVFLRRDFGERYFNRMNFIAGFIVIGFFSFTSGVGATLASFGRSMPEMRYDPEQGGFVPVPEEESSFLSSLIPDLAPLTWVLLFYLLISGYHFFYIWWRNGTGRPLFSFDSGKSWLQPVGRWLIIPVNFVLGWIVRFYALSLPQHERAWLSDAMPVLRDVRDFTERFLEPLFLLILALVCVQAGWIAMGTWVFFSDIALIFYTNLRLLAERNKFLDWQDQGILALFMKGAITGDTDSLRIPYSTKAGIWQMSNLIERTPETMDAIREDAPSLADAMEALNPKLKNMGKNPPSSDDSGSSQQPTPPPAAPAPTAPVASAEEPVPVQEEAPPHSGELTVDDAIKNLKVKPNKPGKK